MGSWIAANRVISVEPGPRDICVVTLVDGRRVSVDHVLDYEKARTKGHQLAQQFSRPVKVLPMGGTELIGFLGLAKADFTPSAETDIEVRELVVSTCREALLECDDGVIRREAYELLVALGGQV